MASFVYNPLRSNKIFDVESNQRQWYDFLQKKEFHDDLKSAIKSEGNSYRNELKRNAELANKDISALRKEFAEISDEQLQSIREQTQSIDRASKMVLDTLDEGFADVTHSLEKGFALISNQIENLSVMLDWRLSEIVDQIRISNILQGNIALLLRVPDFQKERQYYIEQGCKHYTNARFDESLYKDALTNLLEAERREVTDYFVLHRIGMIYLHARKKELLDFVKAEDYFRRAAKYAIVESNPNAQQTLNILAGNIAQNLSTQPTTSEAAKAVAAKAYFQAAVACYLQAKFTEAIELSGKAYALLPSLLEAGFLRAKSLAAIGEGEKSADILAGLIALERFYAAKVALDADLAPKKEVLWLLNQLRNAAVHQASERLNKIKTTMISGSQITSLIPGIEKSIAKNTFFNALRALDELTLKRFWSRPTVENERAYKKIIKIEVSEALSIEEFVPIEREDKNKEKVWKEEIIVSEAKKRQNVAESKKAGQQLWEQILDLLQQAENEAMLQSRKVLGKDFSRANSLYNEAVTYARWLGVDSTMMVEKYEEAKKRR